MSDPNHFFHDLIEGVVIWEDDAKETSPPIDVPADASSLTDTHVDHHHDASEHSGNVVEVQAAHVEDSGAAAEHASDAHAVDVASADTAHDGDVAGA